MQIIFDFSFLLLALAVLTGVIWGLDHWLLRAARAGGREPVVVEYARSFFPIIVIVLLVRSFLFEPFRIPSDSMMPTLLDGDFIFVSKFSYGLRLPVLNAKIVATGEPQRGDVIVFRKPSMLALSGLDRNGRDLVVIGDKDLTDGLLARRAGAHFIKVRRKLDPADRLSSLMANLIDNTFGPVAIFLWDALSVLSIRL